MDTRILLAIFLMGTSAFAQPAPKVSDLQTAHYPNLIRAELPLFPPLAWTAHITGTVTIQVAVERGSVVEAQVKSSSSPALSYAALANVKTWKFEREASATFLVTYIYKIEGEQTPLPENPRIELELPLLVKITARPFKPTTTD